MQRVMLGLLWWLFLCSIICYSSTKSRDSTQDQRDSQEPDKSLGENQNAQKNNRGMPEEEKTEGNSDCAPVSQADQSKKKDQGKDKCKSKNKRTCKDNVKTNNKAKCCRRCNEISSVTKPGVSDAKCCMADIINIRKNGNSEDTIEAIESLEKVLQGTEVNVTTVISSDTYGLALLHKSKGFFKGLHIFASDKEVKADTMVPNNRVSVWLPATLNPRLDDTIVFCMLNVTEESLNASDKLYDSRLVGLSLPRNVSGLKEPIQITINLTTSISENQKPVCHFYDFSTRKFNKRGCDTNWDKDRGCITCSCDHLTYFGILLLSSNENVSDEDQEILTYITLIGCSLSLFSLAIAVMLFIINSKIRADLSMKVHINLVVALILLNLHFLPSQVVAALPSTGPCLYMAVGLHYSLLATFMWTAMEGFHLYRLLVKVFNIYVRRYLLKLSLVGWGFPAVVVSVVMIIDIGLYGRVPMDSGNSNTTAICYITNDTVKMVTVLGVFCLVFLFNFTMFGVLIKRIVSFHFTKEYGQSIREQTKRSVSTLLGLSILLGITWGLVFFSFGHLTTPGLYLFCILNSLQGFFIFLWFVMSFKKTENSSTMTSTETRSTNG